MRFIKFASNFPFAQDLYLINMSRYTGDKVNLTTLHMLNTHDEDTEAFMIDWNLMQIGQRSATMTSTRNFSILTVSGRRGGPLLRIHGYRALRHGTFEFCSKFANNMAFSCFSFRQSFLPPIEMTDA